MPEERVNQIEIVIFDLLAERGPGKTICPSEASRRMAKAAGSPEQWRAWLNRTRVTAIRMAKRGSLVITQGGEPVDPTTVRGAIRLALP